MQTDVQVRKARGRLSRHVQNKLGETLHAMFDENFNTFAGDVDAPVVAAGPRE